MYEEKKTNIEISEELDTRGLFCPEPLFETRTLLETIEPGHCFKVIADDPAADEDLHRWAKRTDTQIVEFRKEGQDLIFIFKKKST
ncbi:MAG: sulfurtransferase TusA family protein [Promethearchaeota archaeon]